MVFLSVTFGFWTDSIDLHYKLLQKLPCYYEVAFFMDRIYENTVLRYWNINRSAPDWM